MQPYAGEFAMSIDVCSIRRVNLDGGSHKQGDLWQKVVPSEHSVCF